MYKSMKLQCLTLCLKSVHIYAHQLLFLIHVKKKPCCLIQIILVSKSYFLKIRKNRYGFSFKGHLYIIDFVCLYSNIIMIAKLISYCDINYLPIL